MKPSSRFLRFVLVGGLNTVFGYGLFAAFTWGGLPYPIAIALATVLGVLFNYQTTGRLVFATQGSGRLWRFIAVYALIYALNVAVVAALVGAGLNVYCANACAMLPIVVASYALQRSFVFGTP